MPGKTFNFQVTKTSSAAPSTLFDLVADGARWSEWAKPLVQSSSLDKPGVGDPNGVGSVRKLGVGKVGVKEETTASEPGKLHAYKLLTPGPVKNYHAEVRFNARQDGGTDLVWSGTATEVIPGTGKVAAAALSKMLGVLADKLVKAAERKG